MSKLMKCGCIAQGVDSVSGEPVCVIHSGVIPGADEVAEELPDLTGRISLCSYCSKERESNFNLPFFNYNPNKKHDSYFCGCIGWD